MSDRPTIVVLGFKQTFERNPLTGNMDRPVDWVEYAPLHAVNTTRVSDRVDKMRPPPSLRNDDEGKKMDFLRYRWEMIDKAYTAWKSGMEIPLNGSPIASWPALNQAQVNAFRNAGLRTIEEVRDLPDSVIGKIPLPGIREIQLQAKYFLEAKESNALASAAASRDARISALEEQLEAAMALLKDQDKPKRGRPRKEDVEVEEAA